MDEGSNRRKNVGPNGSEEPSHPPTRLPDEHEVRHDRSEGPLPLPDDFLPNHPEVHRKGPPTMPQVSAPRDPDEIHRKGAPTMPHVSAPKDPDEIHRKGAPTMPQVSAPKDPDEVRAARQGPPTMPSMANAPHPDEIRAPRQGPPSMPTMTSARDPDEIRRARQGPPSMPSMANAPHPDEIRAPRQGPPRMPSVHVPAADEVRAARQGPPNMPTVASPEPGHVRADRRMRDGTHKPLTTPNEFEVRHDQATHAELPPMSVDPGSVEIEAEGMRRKVRVMTTGVFDLLHLGHIHMLEAARRLGDELYVVIARDDTVRKMKHEPLNGEEVRRQIVENLKPVTKAVLGHVGDIYRTVQDVRPDVIALGFDQKFTEDEVRRKSVEHGVNVRVVRLPQFDHDLDATRKIIERIGDRIAKKELYTQREG